MLVWLVRGNRGSKRVLTSPGRFTFHSVHRKTSGCTERTKSSPLGSAQKTPRRVDAGD